MQLSFKYAFPMLLQTKIYANIIFRGKRELRFGGCKVSYGCIIPCGVSCQDGSSCARAWRGLAGAKVKLEQDKAEPAGCRAGWGTGEGASVANKLQGFFLKEDK